MTFVRCWVIARRWGRDAACNNPPAAVRMRELPGADPLQGRSFLAWLGMLYIPRGRPPMLVDEARLPHKPPFRCPRYNRLLAGYYASRRTAMLSLARVG
jgi:hypothetical protein